MTEAPLSRAILLKRKKKQGALHTLFQKPDYGKAVLIKPFQRLVSFLLFYVASKHGL